MSLRTYDIDLHESLLFAHCDDTIRPFRPGDWVTHKTLHGKGFIIAVTDTEICILWSIEPQLSDFSKFVAPIVRRVYPTLIANQLVSIQPMSVPNGLVFFLDYQYGKDAKLNKRCSEGMWMSKMFWRGYRWALLHTRRFGSSVQSLLRWQFVTSLKKSLPNASGISQ